MTDLRHKSGKSKVVVDCLSQPSANLTHVSQLISPEQLASNQQKDPEVPLYRTALSGLILEDVPFGHFTYRAIPPQSITDLWYPRISAAPSSSKCTVSATQVPSLPHWLIQSTRLCPIGLTHNAKDRPWHLLSRINVRLDTLATRHGADTPGPWHIRPDGAATLPATAGPVPSTYPSLHSLPEFKALETVLQGMHFYIQTDMKRTALDEPYTCPYLVESKGDKFFTGQIGQGADKVSCDRLKPAILDETSPLFSPHPDEDVQGPKWQQWDQESGGLRSCSATKRTRRNRRTRLWKSRKDWCKSGSHAPSEVELLDSVALLTYNILHMPDRVTFS